MLLKWWTRTLGLVLAGFFLCAPALAERDFRIAGTAFLKADILDARGLASLGGEPAVLVTLTDSARSKLQALSNRALGQPIVATLDGRALTGPVVREPIADGMIELTGFSSFEESERLAELISGKPPVPDSMEE